MPAAVSRDRLLGWFQQCCAPRSERVGAEFETLVVDLGTRREVAYEGPAGVGAVLERFRDRGDGWKPEVSEGHLIALSRGDSSSITLEPGNQMEFSSRPRKSVLEIETDLRRFLAEFYRVTEGMNVALLGIGLNPFSSTAEVKLGPKKRYRIMTEYLSKKGDLALDMMRRTMSVHCSFDFAGEADAVEKSRFAFAVTPVVTAIFAHSPLQKLEPNGFQSFRAEIWRRTDPDRCGLIPEVFEKDFGFGRYLDRVLELPLMFTLKNGEYRAAHGLPASSWFAGDWKGLEGHEGLAPEAGDLEWVINQSYRDARLRHYLECRAADFPPGSMALGPVALWTGLIYDAAARAAAWEMMGPLSLDERAALGQAIARDGLRASFRGTSVLSAARDLARLARKGLEKRKLGEERLLDPVDALLAKGKSPSDELLEAWSGPLAKDPAKLIERLTLRA